MKKNDVLNRYFFDLVYTEPCRPGHVMVDMQLQARVYILARDEQEAKDRLGFFFGRPISQFDYRIKKLNSNIMPEIIEPGAPFVVEGCGRN